tara:strand:+ start:1145 stop:1609 length:465 start_codon:yes stop_codon:yes gene_type:complete
MNKIIKNILKQKKLGKKIVMTNGCFDFIHAGHVHYLEKSKELGQILVVAINSDKSVRRLKGNSRPINPLKARKKVLNSLSSVDYVLSFNQDTPIKLFEVIRPDILVKGGDYRGHKIIGEEIIKSYNGEVVILDYLKEFSSTSIINKIKRIDELD